MSSVDAPTRLLDAAEAIVHAGGVSTLTLDAVARHAGVSKGGLLYHFASKEALLNGLMQRLAASIWAEFDANLAAQAPGPGRAARTTIGWAFDCANEQHDRMAAVFLACFHHDPALLDPVRVVFARMKAAIEADGLPPGVGLLVMLACDGLFLAHVFGTYTLTSAERAALRDALAQLTEGGA